MKLSPINNHSSLLGLLIIPSVVAAGLLQGLSFAPAYGFLQIIALCVLMYFTYEAQSVKKAVLYGLLFGLGWFCAAISWIYISVHEYGYVNSAFSIFVVFAFAFLLALFPTLACFIAGLFAKRSRRSLFFILLFPALWGLTEWLRSWILSGFPWAATAYAHIDDPLSGYAPVFGACGINFLAACCSGFFVLWLYTLRAKKTKLSTISLCGILLILAVGLLFKEMDFSKPGDTLSVRLVQGGVGQDEKFSPLGTQKTFERYVSLVNSEGLSDKTLIVLPETIFPIPLDRVPKDLWNKLVEPTVGTSRTLLLGGFIESPKGQFSNDAVLVRDGKISETYQKKHLVPFGEYVPFGFRWFIDMLQIPMGDLSEGTANQKPFNVNGKEIAPMLCYEDLFSSNILEWWEQDKTPDLLVNLSNLGWFGDSLALPQHLNISRMRAMEFARPVVRATNTGATAVVSPKGEVLKELPFMTPGKLDAEVRLYTGPATPYAVSGDSVPLSAMFFALVLAIALPQKKKRLANS